MLQGLGRPHGITVLDASRVKHRRIWWLEAVWHRGALGQTEGQDQYLQYPSSIITSWFGTVAYYPFLQFCWHQGTSAPQRGACSYYSTVNSLGFKLVSVWAFFLHSSIPPETGVLINFAALCVVVVRFGLNAIILIPLANLFLLMPVELEHLLLCAIKKTSTIASEELREASALFRRWVFSVGVRTALHCGRLSCGGGWADGFLLQAL